MQDQTTKTNKKSLVDGRYMTPALTQLSSAVIPIADIPGLFMLNTFMITESYTIKPLLPCPTNNWIE